MKMKFYQSCCSELLCVLPGYIFDLRVLSFKFGISVHDAKYFSIKKFNNNNDHVYGMHAVTEKSSNMLLV